MYTINNNCIILIIILPFIAGIISALIIQSLTRKNQKRQDFNRASEQFWEEVYPIRLELDESNDYRDGKLKGRAKSIIDMNEKQLKFYFIKFSHYFKRRRLKKLKKAFNDLCYTNKNDNEDPRIEYRARKQSQEVEVRKLVRKRLDRLLAFAKRK